MPGHDAALPQHKPKLYLRPSYGLFPHCQLPLLGRSQELVVSSASRLPQADIRTSWLYAVHAPISQIPSSLVVSFASRPYEHRVWARISITVGTIVSLSARLICPSYSRLFLRMPFVHRSVAPSIVLHYPVSILLVYLALSMYMVSQYTTIRTSNRLQNSSATPLGYNRTHSVVICIAVHHRSP